MTAFECVPMSQFPLLRHPWATRFAARVVPSYEKRGIALCIWRLAHTCVRPHTGVGERGRGKGACASVVEGEKGEGFEAHRRVGVSLFIPPSTPVSIVGRAARVVTAVELGRMGDGGTALFHAGHLPRLSNFILSGLCVENSPGYLCAKGGVRRGEAYSSRGLLLYACAMLRMNGDSFLVHVSA